MANEQGMPCLSEAQWSARKPDGENPGESLLLCTYHYESFLLNRFIESGVRLPT